MLLLRETENSILTFNCSDYTVAIFHQLFEELVRPLELQFIAFESLSEVGTVHIAVTELKRRMSHLQDHWASDKGVTEVDTEQLCLHTSTHLTDAATPLCSWEALVTAVLL